jgi:hypothetical protein
MLSSVFQLTYIAFKITRYINEAMLLNSIDIGDGKVNDLYKIGVSMELVWCFSIPNLVIRMGT